MPKVTIIYKANTPAAQEQAQSLGQWLTQRGAGVHLLEAKGGEPRAGNGVEKPLPADTGLVVVLGGDGTMLGAVRQVVANGLERVPILGVNLGGLGFLTALAPDELLPAMEKVLDGHYQASPRLMLDSIVHRRGVELARFTALNDLVINKAALARIVELEAVVDGRPLTTFQADGLIISTPTGSTAYNLSAGGPICHPALNCIVMAPICSFTLTNRPLLLSPDMTLSVTLGQRAQETTLTCDGQVGLELEPGDEIRFQRSEHIVHLIQSPFRDYFEILKTKLRWG
ncbi:MAG: NAD(+)/NADH kinase [Desulfarculaceae bacterium]|nr:NAD(+)/NADH kinase [Desulfarculaceae bacterium]MCF8046523.1 NAD(+)/NADH kinase [Desulfarculaceae bacterium]MCF8064678.1 NAD(+)/NADH kinase [Desulfarculaceae bacterium]MCF8096202.1 NAD(+)/NADH kinase [Desulfarculaceae bacterium]MCF8123435.1 NAD(+)/NADH kinase [Desulfarculaceae bacterium]